MFIQFCQIQGDTKDGEVIKKINFSTIKKNKMIDEGKKVQSVSYFASLCGTLDTQPLLVLRGSKKNNISSLSRMLRCDDC